MVDLYAFLQKNFRFSSKNRKEKGSAQTIAQQTEACLDHQDALADDRNSACTECRLLKRAKQTPKGFLGLTISLTVNVALCLALIVKFSDIYGASKTCEHVTDKNFSVCVGCANGLVQIDGWNKYPEKDEGDQLCCLQKDEPLARLVQMFSLQQSSNVGQMKTERNSRRIILRPSGHVYMNMSSLKSGFLKWTADGGMGAFLSKVALVDNKFRIPETGDYFLYSLITYTSRGYNRAQTVNHCIYRANPALPRTGNQLLLLGKNVISGDVNGFQTSFLSSVIRLRKDDRVFTFVSNFSFVFGDMHSNFMGLFKL